MHKEAVLCEQKYQKGGKTVQYLMNMPSEREPNKTILIGKKRKKGIGSKRRSKNQAKEMHSTTMRNKISNGVRK